MESSFNFYLDPRGINVQDFTAGIASIRIARPSGQTLAIDPTGTPLVIQQEHPPVERMEGDLGAICQVFKESSAYFLRISGVPLAPGDQVTLTYQHKAYSVSLRVTDIENGRARIEPPLVIQSPNFHLPEDAKNDPEGLI